VGHLTDDADAGEDKMERMAAARRQSIWDVAEHYKQAYWADVRALNIRQPAQWTVATDYVPQMIAFAEGIAAKHCYELPSGLYFDVSTVADYGRLARAATDAGPLFLRARPLAPCPAAPAPALSRRRSLLSGAHTADEPPPPTQPPPSKLPDAPGAVPPLPWRAAEAEIVRDIDPVVQLIKDILHSDR
jgi:hypothetical protein